MLRTIEFYNNNQIHKFIKQLVTCGLLSDDPIKNSDLVQELIQDINGETYLLPEILEASPEFLKYQNIYFYVRGFGNPDARLHVSEIAKLTSEYRRRLIHNSFLAELLIDIHRNNKLDESIHERFYLFPVNDENGQIEELSSTISRVSTSNNRSELYFNKAAFTLLLVSYKSLLKADNNIPLRKKLFEFLKLQSSSQIFNTLINLNHKELATAKNQNQKLYSNIAYIPTISLGVMFSTIFYMMQRMRMSASSLVFLPFIIILGIRTKVHLQKYVDKLAVEVATKNFIIEKFTQLNAISDFRKVLLDLVKVENKPELTNSSIFTALPTAALIQFRPVLKSPNYDSKAEVKTYAGNMKRL